MSAAGSASISVKRVFGLYAARFPFDVHLDGQCVASVDNGATVRLVVSPGTHELYVKYDRYTSDVAPVVVGADAPLEMRCGAKPLIRDKGFKILERVVFFVIGPIVILSLLVPAAKEFVDKYLAVPIAAAVGVFAIGITLHLPQIFRRLFSTEPGAMLYLVQVGDQNMTSEPMTDRF
jgi:hypothetical protein